MAARPLGLAHQRSLLKYPKSRKRSRMTELCLSLKVDPVWLILSLASRIFNMLRSYENAQSTVSWPLGHWSRTRVICSNILNNRT